MEEKTETYSLSRERVKQLAEEVCRLQYDVTSVAFEKLYSLLLSHNLNPNNKNSKHSGNASNPASYVSSASMVWRAKLEIDNAWTNSKDYMSGCEHKHAKNIEGYNSVEEVIMDVYDSGQIDYFMICGVNELMNQSRKDKEANHLKLSSCLLRAAYSLDEAIDELSQNY